MISIDDQDVIQAFFSNTLNPSFSKGIYVGSLKRVLDDVDAFGLENGIKSQVEFGVIVVDSVCACFVHDAKVWRFGKYLYNVIM